tara:strand:- start:209 stop:532 length:324 start_codon:yes stop_codon:yes gene_type:complete
MAVVNVEVGASGVGQAQVTLSGTPNTMQEIKINGSALMCEIVFLSNEGFLIHSGGTDGAVISTEIKKTIKADQEFFWPIGKSASDHSIWVASSTASTVVHVLTYEGV